jgi:hypothetical protein
MSVWINVITVCIHKLNYCVWRNVINVCMENVITVSVWINVITA